MAKKRLFFEPREYMYLLYFTATDTKKANHKDTKEHKGERNAKLLVFSFVVLCVLVVSHRSFFSALHVSVVKPIVCVSE